MTNNDILRSIRYTFDFNDKKMINMFELGGLEVSRAEISDWLKPEEDAAYKNCSDTKLARFLNGLIIHRRGPKDDSTPKPEGKMNNNIVFMKLKIALNLKADEILEIINRVGLRISKHELSAFFRRSDHKHFRQCKDQILRNFLKGIQVKYRPEN